MGIFSTRKNIGQGESIVPLARVDTSMPDSEWFAASLRVYEDTWRSRAGSPETFAQAGREHYDAQNVAVAMLFFRKAIDLMHTLYTFSGMASRRPSAADSPIVSGFVGSLKAVLEEHPAAPVAESVREVTHRLRTIASACKRSDIPADLYLSALQQIGAATPDVDVDDIIW